MEPLSAGRGVGGGVGGVGGGGGGDIAVIIHISEDQSGWCVEDEYGGSQWWLTPSVACFSATVESSTCKGLYNPAAHILKCNPKLYSLNNPKENLIS